MKLLKQLPLLALVTFLSFSCSTDNVEDNVDAITEKLVTPATKTIEV